MVNFDLECICIFSALSQVKSGHHKEGLASEPAAVPDLNYRLQMAQTGYCQARTRSTLQV
jgi:hypothetical protein